MSKDLMMTCRSEVKELVESAWYHAQYLFDFSRVGTVGSKELSEGR